MNIKTFIADWISAGNAYDTENYIDKYQQDAILKDPSVGRIFTGHQGIREYFSSYFIGYKTQTRLIQLNVEGDKVYLEVEFTGEFPEQQIRGSFDFTFKDEKIATVTADLISNI